MSKGYELEIIPAFGDEWLGVIDADGNRFIVPKRICECLGVDWGTQFAKLKKESWSGIVFFTIPDARGCMQKTCVIPERAFYMWLSTIATGRVKPEFREKLDLYKGESCNVLAKHWGNGGRPQKDRDFDDPIVRSLREATEIRLKQIEQDRELLAINVRLEEQKLELLRITREREQQEARIIEAERKTIKAVEDANRAMRTVTSEPGWYCLVPWAEVHGIHLPPGNQEGQDSWEGKRLKAICLAHGIEPKKHATERYPLNRKTRRGGVNSAPEEMLELWRDDYLGRFSVVNGGNR